MSGHDGWWSLSPPEELGPRLPPDPVGDEELGCAELVGDSFVVESLLSLEEVLDDLLDELGFVDVELLVDEGDVLDELGFFDVVVSLEPDDLVDELGIAEEDRGVVPPVEGVGVE